MLSSRHASLHTTCTLQKACATSANSNITSPGCCSSSPSLWGKPAACGYIEATPRLASSRYGESFFLARTLHEFSNCNRQQLSHIIFSICRRYTACSKLPGRLGVYLPSAGRLAEGWDTATQTQSCDDSTIVDVPKLSWPTHQLQPFKTMCPSRNTVTLGCNMTLASLAATDPANFTAGCASLYPSHVNGPRASMGRRSWLVTMFGKRRTTRRRARFAHASEAAGGKRPSQSSTPQAARMRTSHPGDALQ